MLCELPTCARLVMENKDKNRIVSYPRSGISWLMMRLNRFLCHRFGMDTGLIEGKKKGPAHGFLKHSHLGYFPHASKSVTPSSERHMLRYPPDTQVTILLRDAKAVLSSIYRYRQSLSLPVGDSVSDFLKSKVGVSLFCAYTNDLTLIVRRQKKDRLRLRALYYEDMFEPRFIDSLPSLLGLGCVLTDEEREGIAADSYFIVHPSSQADRWTDADQGYQETKYSKTLTPDDAAFVDAYLKKNCRLDFYSDRYC